MWVQLLHNQGSESHMPCHRIFSWLIFNFLIFIHSVNSTIPDTAIIYPVYCVWCKLLRSLQKLPLVIIAINKQSWEFWNIVYK